MSRQIQDSVESNRSINRFFGVVRRHRSPVGSRCAYSGRAILLVCSFLVAAALAGCAEQDQAIQRITNRQQALGSTPIVIGKSAFPSPVTDTLEGKAEPATEGGAALRDYALVYSGVEEAVKQNGIPDAIESYSVGWHWNLAFFYRDPPRSFFYEISAGLPKAKLNQVMDIKEVPRSVRRQAFGEGPMPPPWPVTVPAAQPDIFIFGVPKSPELPQQTDSTAFSSTYSAISAGILGKITEVRQGKAFDRASKAFARIDPSSKLPGFNWRLVVIRTPEIDGFAVPDGSLFLSDGLVTMLSDDELVGVIAHLLGHEAYGHGRSWWLEAGPVKRVAARVGAVTTGTVLVGAGLMGCGGYGGGCEVGLKVAGAGIELATADFSPAELPSYSRDEEMAAN